MRGFSAEIGEWALLAFHAAVLSSVPPLVRRSSSRKKPTVQANSTLPSVKGLVRGI